MNLGRLSINQPILAMVLSIVLLIVGAIAYRTLPVAEYPEVVPPTVVVTAQYPGASAQTISDTVAAPIEQQINGVEDMLYMYSQATSNGQLTITITFRLGTDLDKAQVLVQNRVAIAQPQLPEEVQRNGVVTKKDSPDILMVVFMLSPDDSLDQLYISNYALLQVRDQLLRLDGIGDNPDLRRARLFDAAVARSRQDRESRPDFERCGCGGPRPEPADCGRPACEPTDCRPRLPAESNLRWPAEGSVPIRGHRRQIGPGRPHRAPARRGADRARSARLFHQQLPVPQVSGGVAGDAAARIERACDRQGH
ncbi:hypothetical protein ABIF13_002011 [Bradyrhizobium elkanii]